jgi:glutathionylspermidine synthase
MWRHLSQPRDGWRDHVEKLGLVYPMTDMPDGSERPYWNESAWYEITMDEVERMEEATEELYQMCLVAAKHMATSGDFTDQSLRLPSGSLELVRKSLERGDPSVYARFDLVIDDSGVPKMLEINGDTPTGLLETAVIQWDWLESRFPDGDQWNSVHDRLVMWWGAHFKGKRVHFVHTGQERSGEEEMTTTYMRDTAHSAGVETYGHTIEGIGWDETHRDFVDMHGHEIETCFKLYPWEDMLAENFDGITREATPVQWVEPVWKLMMSTKALLGVLWELYPDHPNLLPAYNDGPRDLEEWVAKPYQGREGANIKIHTRDMGDRVLEGKYGDQPYTWQKYQELPSFDGNRLVIGSWVIDGKSAGCLFRESDGPVTDYYSRVVPHAIGDGLRPDAATVQKWLSE